jgi:hypothetical protein
MLGIVRTIAALLIASALAAPGVAQGQHAEKMYRIGMMSTISPASVHSQALRRSCPVSMILVTTRVEISRLNTDGRTT